MSVPRSIVTPARTLASVCAIVMLASSCGADGPDAAGSGPATTAAPAPDAPDAPDATDAAVPDAASEAGGSAVEANGETVDVVALDNTFRPDSVEVVAGTAIRWENRGRNDHDVLPADETLSWGVDVSGFAPGDEYTVLFDTPGDYPYYCSIHGTKDVGMIGTIVVVAADA